MKLIQELLTLSEASVKKPYQVRIETKMGSGDWQDIELFANSIADIANAVSEFETDDAALGRFDLGQLTGIVEDFIGKGPGRHLEGTWDEMDFDVKSMSDDVLKISWTFSGVYKDHPSDKMLTPKTKSGIITIMPGN